MHKKSFVLVIIMSILMIGSVNQTVAQTTVTLSYADELSEGDTFEWEVSIDGTPDEDGPPVEDGDTITLEILTDSPTVVADEGILGNYIAPTADIFKLTAGGEEYPTNVTNTQTFIIPLEFSNGITVKQYLENVSLGLYTIKEDGNEITMSFSFFGIEYEHVYSLENGIMQSLKSSDGEGNSYEYKLAGGGLFGLPISPIPVITAFTAMLLAVPILKRRR